MERRIPIDDQLIEIVRRQRELAVQRQPRSRGGVRITECINKRFTQTHVFVTTANTPLGVNLYREFMRACKLAGIETETVDARGNVVEILDLHSTRHTFATDLILNGADPKTVQTLMGHRTLDMTMKIYAKVFVQQKRAAIGKLSYGAGVSTGREVIPYAEGA
jgi:integrase